MTIGLVGTLLLLTAVLLGIRYETQRATGRMEVEAKADEYAAGLSSILAIPLWTLDVASTEHIGSVYRQNNLLASLGVHDNRGELIYGFGEPLPADLGVTRTQDITYEGETIGSVSFTLSLERHRQELRQLLRDSLLTLALAALVILAATGLLLRVFMRKPLADLEQGMEAVSHGEFHASSMQADYKELSNIVATFKEMAATIKARENSLIQVNEALSREVNERKAAEEARARSESRLMAIFNAAPVGIGQVANRVIDWPNAGLMAMTGYEAHELKNRTSEFFYINREEFERVGRQLYADMHGWQRASIESQWRTKQGKVIDVLISVSFIEPDDFDSGFVFTAMDITERKNAEALREQLINELEDKNAELERFTYTVSHDLKSPIITIKGFLGMLERDIADNDGPRIRSDMNRINQAADKMQALLEELLELSRIGRLVNPPEDIDLDAMVEDVVELVSGRLSKGAIEVRVAPALPAVRGDRPRIQEVLLNIMDNAAKFMPEREDALIEIGWQRTDDPNLATIYVRDNGIGIKQEHMNKIFGLFDQLDPRQEGTGIGLALVQRIVETHGGKIWVESDGPGTGATFLFTLPLAERPGR
ncbi:MAG: ATP-binding protein [Desulfovibrionaceae bacterium]